LTDAAYTNECCPLCGGKGAQYFECSTARYGDYHIDECKACDFIYVREIPSKSFLRDAYRLRYGESDVFELDRRLHKKIKNWFFAKRLRMLAGAHRRRVLEVGYAQGNLLRALKREGTFEAEGIDLAHAPYEYLKSLGLKVSISSIEDMKFSDGKFDIVVGLHVIEHLHDLRLFMKEIYRVLSERGRLYLQVPTPAHWRARLAGRRWKHYDPPFHLWYFAPKSIRRLLTSSGFRVLSAHCLSNRTHLTVVAEKI
jgi:SAM-dependent methyltransferase